MTLTDEKIKEIFSKTALYLVKKQKENGNWAALEATHKEPSMYHKEIITTMDATKALILLNQPKTTTAIRKAVLYCSNYELELWDEVDLWAAKLHILKFSDIYKKEKQKIVNFLCKKQRKGHWESYPNIINLTNYIVSTALNGFGCKKEMDSLIRWLKKIRAEDRRGWGIGKNPKNPEVTFTSNAVLSLIIAGENPNLKYLQKVRKFLEESQDKSGGWRSSKLTTSKITTYATALATLSLMLLSKNPFNKKVEKGIALLLKQASKTGGWPLIQGEKAKTYSTFYAVQTLCFYLYLKKMLGESNIIFLKKYMNPQQLTAYLFKGFDNWQKRRLKELMYKDLIDSKTLGTTPRAIKRRKDIIRILSDGKKKMISDIINELRKKPEYSFLSKKSHMTQIKSDVEYLRDINLIDKIKYYYFMATKLF